MLQPPARGAPAVNPRPSTGQNSRKGKGTEYDLKMTNSNFYS